MKKSTFANKRSRIFLLLLLPLVAWAFPADASLKAWIDMSREGADARIGGIVSNEGQSQLSLSYRLLVTHQSPSGRSSNTQQDDFVVLPGQKVRLSEVQLSTIDKSSFRAIFEVFEGSKRIAIDSLIQGEAAVAQKAAPATESAEELELDGLIINETRSKIGADFYDFFYRNWSPPLGAKDFVIRIKELPVRGRVAHISIVMNDEELTQRMIQPRAELIEIQAGQAIRLVRAQLKKRAGLKKELENGDQEGSGLYD